MSAPAETLEARLEALARDTDVCNRCAHDCGDCREDQTRVILAALREAAALGASEQRAADIAWVKNQFDTWGMEPIDAMPLCAAAIRASVTRGRA